MEGELQEKRLFRPVFVPPPSQMERKGREVSGICQAARSDFPVEIAFSHVHSHREDINTGKGFFLHEVLLCQSGQDGDPSDVADILCVVPALYDVLLRGLQYEVTVGKDSCDFQAGCFLTGSDLRRGQLWSAGAGTVFIDDRQKLVGMDVPHKLPEDHSAGSIPTEVDDGTRILILHRRQDRGVDGLQF